MKPKVSKVGNQFMATLKIEDIKGYGNTESEAINDCKREIIEFLNMPPDPVTLWKTEGYYEVLKYSKLQDTMENRRILTEAFLHSLPPKVNLDDFVEVRGNYKTYNTYGDAILSVAIIEMLMSNGSKNITTDKMPIITRQNVGNVMIKRGYNKYIISSLDLTSNVNIQGEILEAWIGALATIDRDLGIDFVRNIFHF